MKHLGGMNKNKVGIIMQGRIVEYIPNRGFGFIANELNVRERIFFHINSWVHDQVFPETGMIVAFDTAAGSPGRGPQAVNVRLVKLIAVSLQKSNPVDALAKTDVKESR
jgi:cold shock CspA family protein